MFYVFSALEWCHVHKFELIDMGPLESIDLAEEMEQEKHGIERIIEALHTHSWPNRILKGILYIIILNTNLYNLTNQ